MESITIGPCIYNSTYFLSNLSYSMVHLNLNIGMCGAFEPPFLSIKHSSPPSASHRYIRLEVGLEIQRYCCHLTPGVSQPGTLYLATLEGYQSTWCTCTLPNQSPVACCLCFLFFPGPKVRLYISSKISPPTANESIWHYQNYQMVASHQTSTKFLPPLSPRPGLDL